MVELLWDFIVKLKLKIPILMIVIRYICLVLFLYNLSCNPSTHKETSISDKTISWKFRPNILWLVAEDLSPVIPPFGDSTIVTPNLSWLADQGIRYPNTFSPSGVCAPSRAALAMGMYPCHFGAQHMRTGFWANGKPTPEQVKAQSIAFPPGLPMYEAMPPPEARMHSEYLRRQGYYCSNQFKQDYQFLAPVTAWDECSPIADWKKRVPGQPFFSIINFGITHESQIWERANDSLWVDSLLPVPVPPYLPNTPIALNDIRRMYSNIKIMDEQVGKIIARLKAEGLLDSTVIFWYADHGGPLPRQKRLCYDSGLKAPLIIRYPNQWQAGSIDSQLISFVDFLPSLLSLAQASPPKLTDGQAFVGVNQAKHARTYIHGGGDRFDEKYDMIRAVRDKRFKYLRNFDTTKSYYLAVNYREQMPIMKELLRLRSGNQLNDIQAQWFRNQKTAEELFDTYTDPYELNNLASHPQYADKLIELRSECNRWMKAIDDKGLIDEKKYIRSIWQGDQQPITQNPEINASGTQISISCKTPGASIGYKIISNGKEPSSWQVYTKPFELLAENKLKIVSHRIGFLSSPIIEY